MSTKDIDDNDVVEEKKRSKHTELSICKEKRDYCLDEKCSINCKDLDFFKKIYFELKHISYLLELGLVKNNIKY